MKSSKNSQHSKNAITYDPLLPIHSLLPLIFFCCINAFSFFTVTHFHIHTTQLQFYCIHDKKSKLFVRDMRINRVTQYMCIYTAQLWNICIERVRNDKKI